METRARAGGRSLTLHSLLQHGEAVGDLGLQLVDLERSADRQTETTLRLQVDVYTVVVCPVYQ